MPLAKDQVGSVFYSNSVWHKNLSDKVRLSSWHVDVWVPIKILDPDKGFSCSIAQFNSLRWSCLFSSISTSHLEAAPDTWDWNTLSSCQDEKDLGLNWNLSKSCVLPLPFTPSIPPLNSSLTPVLLFMPLVSWDQVQEQNDGTNLSPSFFSFF